MKISDIIGITLWSIFFIFIFRKLIVKGFKKLMCSLSIHNYKGSYGFICPCQGVYEKICTRCEKRKN